MLQPMLRDSSIYGEGSGDHNSKMLPLWSYVREACWLYISAQSERNQGDNKRNQQDQGDVEWYMTDFRYESCSWSRSFLEMRANVLKTL